MTAPSNRRRPRPKVQPGPDGNLTRFRRILRRRLPKLQQSYGVRSIWLFGSYVRGEARQRSDLDIMVEFDELSRLSLLEFIGLEHELSDWLGVPVDLVEKNGLKPAIGQNVLREAIAL